jgi:hypothetical protein
LIGVSLVAALIFGTLVVWAVRLSVVYEHLSRRISEQESAVAELRSRLLAVEGRKIKRIEDYKIGSSHR